MKSLVVILIVSVSLVFGEERLIDLTHTLGFNTVKFPFSPPFNLTNTMRREINDSIVIVGNVFKTSEHVGTHMGAPQHVCVDGKVVHQISLKKLSGPGVVIDLKSKAEQNNDYVVTLQDILDWESKHGVIPKGAIVLINFGWFKFWPDAEKVFKSNDLSNSSTYHYPTLGLEASRHLSGTRKVHAVGVDSPSIDKGLSVAINLMCEHEIIIMENVDNLDAVPATGSYVYIGAVKLENGSGAPARLFAVVDDEKNLATLSRDLIDLTHTLGYSTVNFPFAMPFNFSRVVTFFINDSIIVVGNQLQAVEHMGTHIDAPRHFCAQGKTVDQVPIEDLAGPGVVIDLTSKAEKNNDYKVTTQDILAWEKRHGPIPRGAVVLFNFGWDKNWPNAERVFRAGDMSNYSTYHFPGVGIEATRYLSETRRVKAVGVDTPSPDRGLSVHINLLCNHGLIILENVANLDAMPATGSHVYIAAVKLENAGGAPTRLFATVDDDWNTSGAGEITPNIVCIGMMLGMIVMFLTKFLSM